MSFKVLIAVLLVAQVAYAAEPAKDDETVLSRLDWSHLTQVKEQAKSVKAEARCALYTPVLRKMLADKAQPSVFDQVVRALSKKQPLSAVEQSILGDLQVCQKLVPQVVGPAEKKDSESVEFDAKHSDKKAYGYGDGYGYGYDQYDRPSDYERRARGLFDPEEARLRQRENELLYGPLEHEARRREAEMLYGNPGSRLAEHAKDALRDELHYIGKKAEQKLADKVEKLDDIVEDVQDNVREAQDRIQHKLRDIDEQARYNQHRAGRLYENDYQPNLIADELIRPRLNRRLFRRQHENAARSSWDRSKVQEYLAEERRDALIARELDPIRKLSMQLEDERRLNSRLRSLIDEQLDEIDELDEKVDFLRVAMIRTKRELEEARRLGLVGRNGRNMIGNYDVYEPIRGEPLDFDVYESDRFARRPQQVSALVGPGGAQAFINGRPEMSNFGRPEFSNFGRRAGIWRDE